MWILFSPSEKKCLNHPMQVNSAKQFYSNFICKGLMQTLLAYVEFLQTKSDTEIAKLFGNKTIDLDALSLAQNCLNAPLLEAILRYDGVAFNALNFNTLNNEAKNYIYKKVLIFSNLFGVLRAKDAIPYYDLKQGESFNLDSFSFRTQSFYAQNTENIWEFLAQNTHESLEFLDLRANFYQKCLALEKSPLDNIVIYTPNFIKKGKVVSHYAKFYRGILLKECANNGIQKLESLLNLHIEGIVLHTTTTTTKKNFTHTHLTYHIKDF